MAESSPRGGSVPRRSAERAKAVRLVHRRRRVGPFSRRRRRRLVASAHRTRAARAPLRPDEDHAVEDKLREAANARPPRELPACVPQHDTHRRALRFAAEEGARARPAGLGHGRDELLEVAAPLAVMADDEPEDRPERAQPRERRPVDAGRPGGVLP